MDSLWDAFISGARATCSRWPPPVGRAQAKSLFRRPESDVMYRLGISLDDMAWRQIFFFLLEATQGAFVVRQSRRVRRGRELMRRLRLRARTS